MHDVRVLSWNRERSKFDSDGSQEGIKVSLIGPRCPERSFRSFILKLPIFWISCLRMSKNIQFNVVHAHDFDTLPIGYLISKLRGARLVYDAHESYADMIVGEAPKWIISWVIRIEGMLQKRADVVIASNPKVAERIGAKRSIIVMNCPSKGELAESVLEVSPKERTGDLILGYFGSLEPGRFIGEAMVVIPDQKQYKLVIAGDGTLIRRVKEFASKSDQIAYFGLLSHSEVIKRSKQCYAMLIMFDPSNRNNRIGAPNRLFEAMAMGIPVIVTENTLAAEIVKKEKCGFACKYDIFAFIALLKELRNRIPEAAEAGSQGRAAYEREYNWEAQVSKMLDAYSRLS